MAEALRLSFPQLDALQRAAGRRDAARTAAMANAVRAAAGAVMDPKGHQQFRKFVEELAGHAHG